MAVGTALIDLRRMLRAEVTQSLGMQQGVNAQDQYDIMLARQQIELWEQYEWPHLEWVAILPFVDGQFDYPYPAGLTFDSINKVYCTDGVSSVPTFVQYRLPVQAQTVGSDRGWPVTHWGNKALVSGTPPVTTPNGQMRVFPAPRLPSGGVQPGLRIIAQAPCNPLVASADIAVLDDRLIVLFTAAEILAQQKNEGAPLKLQKANQYVRRMLNNQGGDKRRIHVLGGAQINEAMAQNQNGMNFRIPPT